MTEIVQSAPTSSVTVPLSWQKIFLFTTAVLASTVVLKFGAVQYLEIVYYFLIVFLLILFVRHDLRATWFRVLFWILLAYAFFSFCAFALSLSALRFNFYLPIYLPLLKRPGAITLARIAELVASVCAMLYMAQVFGRDIYKLRYTMLVYFWTGFASGVYSLVCVPINYATGQLNLWIFPLGAYSEAHRLRGFYNEGGPYGLYMMSVLIIGYVLDREGWMPRTRVRLMQSLMLIVFILSYSKAGFMGVITLFVLNGVFARSLAQRLVIVGTGLVIFIGITQFVNIPVMLRAYQATAAQYERVSHFHAHDYNFVYGRVAGAFIVPRMIAAHPLSGIGWGNYGLLRNAPEYRGAAVFTEDADDPGLGMFGAAAELGLPLLGFLLILLFFPFFYLRHLHVPIWVSNLALLQPIVHLYGAQLNLTYPWVVTAFALGFGLNWSSRSTFLEKTADLQVS